MKKNLLKISFLIILIITSIILFTKSNRSHIQIKLKYGEIIFSENVVFDQSPYLLKFNSDNIMNFL